MKQENIKSDIIKKEYPSKRETIELLSDSEDEDMDPPSNENNSNNNRHQDFYNNSDSEHVCPLSM